MITPFSDIKVLIWDFDGTLYKQNPALWNEILEAEYRVVADHTGWSRAQVLEKFVPLHEKLKSGTETTAQLSGITTVQAAKECERYVDRGKFLVYDEQLVTLFKNLSKFRHFMLVNGIIEQTKKNLTLLGLNSSLFEEIVTAETVGENKPSVKGFHYILDKTKLLAQEHLMIGDREAVDLVPAKKMGIKTCLVWSENKNILADFNMPTVYDLTKILLG